MSDKELFATEFDELVAHNNPQDEQVDELEVECFYEYYDKEKDLEMLIINVE